MKVFVYGTLRQGFGNHHFLEGAKYLGEARLPGTMYHLGGFPGVRFDEGNLSVTGEVYELRDETQLKRLDMLEGVPDLYQRLEMEEVGDYGTVFTYQINPRFTTESRVIEDGVWK